eukprot:m.69680 g.69680  ORF g.69680 m.69680 type:complete len:83 (-) comp12235_c0_seq2:1839-2087(-)
MAALLNFGGSNNILRLKLLPSVFVVIFFPLSFASPPPAASLSFQFVLLWVFLAATCWVLYLNVFESCCCITAFLNETTLLAL